MKKYTIKTLGCRVNQYDTQAVREQLRRAGWEELAADGGAALCVINTCTVTEQSDDKARYFIRQARRKNPGAKIVLTGCFTNAMRHIPGVDAYIPNEEKPRFLEKAGLLPEGEHFDLLGAAFSISQFEGRTRAFVKIQDGCDAFCSFCVIPFVRGRSRSRGVADIVEEVRRLAGNGYQEIVLTGIHLASYGLKKADPHTLSQVFEAVDHVSGLKRLRVSSIEPMGITRELVETMSRCEKLMPHFHLPLQSASDRVLEAMRRGYTAGEFRRQVEWIHSLFPRPSVSADVIVGFPGETDGDVEDTIRVAREADFSKTHLFPYSRRAGTLAARLPELPRAVVEERMKRLAAETDAIALAHKKRFLGETVEVLVEETHENGVAAGYTPNYLRVQFPETDDLKNRFVPVTLEDCVSTHFTGVRADALSESAV